MPTPRISLASSSTHLSMARCGPGCFIQPAAPYGSLSACTSELRWCRSDAPSGFRILSKTPSRPTGEKRIATRALGLLCPATVQPALEHTSRKGSARCAGSAPHSPTRTFLRRLQGTAGRGRRAVVGSLGNLLFDRSRDGGMELYSVKYFAATTGAITERYPVLQ